MHEQDATLEYMIREAALRDAQEGRLDEALEMNTMALTDLRQITKSSERNDGNQNER